MLVDVKAPIVAKSLQGVHQLPVRRTCVCPQYPVESLAAFSRTFAGRRPQHLLRARGVHTDSRTQEEAVSVSEHLPEDLAEDGRSKHDLSQKAEERIARVQRERATYLVAAIASSVGFIFLAAAAVIYRFASQMQVSAGFINPSSEHLGEQVLASVEFMNSLCNGPS